MYFVGKVQGFCVLKQVVYVLNINTQSFVCSRNMFPVLTAEVSGLEPEARYFVIMEICLSSDRRYKFVGRHWKATGTADLQLPRNARVFIHQDSPATGAHWMREPIKMKSAKLTNNSMNRSGHVSFWPLCGSHRKGTIMLYLKRTPQLYHIRT